MARRSDSETTPHDHVVKSIRMGLRGPTGRLKKNASSRQSTTGAAPRANPLRAKKKSTMPSILRSSSAKLDKPSHHEQTNQTAHAR